VGSAFAAKNKKAKSPQSGSRGYAATEMEKPGFTGRDEESRHSRMLLAVVRLGSPQARPELDPRLKYSGATTLG
jgi:hypothetical protein